MTNSPWVFAVVACVLGAIPVSAAEPLLPLHVLYVGSASSPRARHFEAFLKRHFATVATADRHGFNPARARDADVVLFDWSQSERREGAEAFPLGRLDEWTRPTVLLNSAGLLTAEHWHVIGGAG